MKDYELTSFYSASRVYVSPPRLYMHTLEQSDLICQVECDWDEKRIDWSHEPSYAPEQQKE